MSIMTFSGLASGIQWQDLIDEMMRLESRPVDRLRTQVKDLEARTSAWGTFRAQIERLETAAKSLASGAAFRSYDVAVRGLPDGMAAPFSATASTDAAPGSFRISVLELATAEKLGGSQSFETRTDALGIEGGFSINGAQVQIEAGDSLNQIVARINATNTGANRSGVSATILNVADGDYRLVMTSEQTGAAGIELVDSGGVLRGLGILDEADKRQQIVPGTDARLRIDGVEITRSENTISDLVPGMTFRLTSANPDLVTEAVVTRNSTTAADEIGALVKSYNDIVDFIENQSKGTATGTGAAIGRDQLLRSMRTQLRDALQAQLPGDDEGGLRRLGEIGIEIDRHGRFTIDSKRLNDALANDPTGVERLFGIRETVPGEGEAAATEIRGVAVILADLAKQLLGTESGSIKSITERVGEQIGGVNRRITQMEARLERRHEQLTRQYAALEQMFSRSQSQMDWLSAQLGSLGGMGR